MGSSCPPASARQGEPIRVYHLIKSLGRGGAETLLLETLKNGDRQGFEYLYGYFLPWKNALVSSLEGEGASVACFGARNNLSILMSARRVARHLRGCGADVLHCHLPIAGVVGRLAGKLARVPVVYTEHNRMERYHPLTRRLNLSTWGWQQQVIAVSADVAESVHRHITSPVPLEVVLNGVDVRAFDRSLGDGSALRRSLGIDADAPVVGTVAVFRTQKRLGDWLEAARLLRGSHGRTHFVVVGDGPLRSELQARASALGLSDVVHWVGLQSDVRPYLAAMDAYMMSSIVEGLPIALLEAMSMRCAVVVTAVGGIPELVRDGYNGVLVPAERPDLLARAAARVLSAPGLIASLGEAARRTVEERFSIRRMTERLEGTYADVVHRYRGG
jgi:glycosyltransferase involved in cell wall biosynthesis